MKMDDKIQKKYREELKKQENHKRYTIEMMIIVTIIVLIVALNLIIPEF
ncbi:hypothetical protein P9D34_21960 [Bacillus swezeyi]|nr:hypothetical protein [Bacillus swezeyi]MEC1263036.1 hypothetical protein [Bacillus swezeyi]MED2930436.1 hypothetical protein [Bacillus swezeyi]MED2944628.1 hypothetical protein [Bacillus swezeyi]MED2963978.1 hypothetical protein [Bacillus swezeyi]MED2975230.1 hypothetical protein [Bacillus swezeyi]